MSADLVIIAAPSDMGWMAGWQRLQAATTIGDVDEDDGPHALTWDEWGALRRELRLEERPGCWIGQVSWLKAGLSGDHRRFIPGPVEAVHALLEPAPVLTPGLASAVMVAMNQPNHSIYGSRRYYYGRQRISGPRIRMIDPTIYLVRKPEHNAVYSGVARRRHVKQWLARHMGRRLVVESQ